MRAFFLLLVLANLAFFAWGRLVAPPDAVADPAPLGRQIAPEKLRIVGHGEPPAAKAAPAPAASTVAAAPSAACLEWGSFPVADAPKYQKALEPLALGARLSERQTEETAGWWVYIAPQGGAAARQAALKKTAELKALKVEDYFVVSEEGPYHWAISLGVFRNEDAAQARLAALRGQGVRSAQVGPREMVVPKVWLQVKGVDAVLEPRLREIARQVDGTELRPCPAG